jgi:hypothetical protein
VRKQMTDRIRAGTMLIADGTPMPESVVVSTEYHSGGWSSIVRCTSAQLDKQIEDAGWTFFYMAGEIHTSGFGFNDQSRTDRAVAHLIAAVKRDNCNCLEITKVKRRSFLGLRYTSLIAHARHIQRSRSFHDRSIVPASTSSRPRELLYDQPATRSKSMPPGEAVQAWENEGGPAQAPPLSGVGGIGATA